MKIFLTQKYSNDIENILNYTEEKFGSEVKEELYFKTRHLLILISNNPKIGTDKYSKKESEFILRCFKVPGYPFLFFYSFDEVLKQINVHRLIHENMDILDLNLF
jgi:plasmid stabilization system protein ParE